MIYHNGYDDLLDLEDVVKMAFKSIKPHRRDFDSIVVTGLSGVIVGIPVSLALKKPCVILRKEGESGHSDRPINVSEMGYRVLFLDDFISGGDTKKRIVEFVEDHGAKVVNTYVYREDEYRKG